MAHGKRVSLWLGLLISSVVLAGCCCSTLPGTARRVQGTVASSLRATATPSRRAPTVVVSREEPTPVPPTPTPEVPTPEVQADWVLYERPEDGFALELPSSWKVLDLSEGDLRSILESVAELNPEMKAFVEGQAETLIASGCKLYAFEIDLASLAEGSVPNVMVMKQAQPLEISLGLLVDVTVAGLESVEYVQKPVRHHRVHLPAGEAEAIEMDVVLNTPGGGTASTSAVEYLMLVDGEIYTVTMGTSTDRAEVYAPVFDQIIQSFRLLE